MSEWQGSGLLIHGWPKGHAGSIPALSGTEGGATRQWMLF